VNDHAIFHGHRKEALEKFVKHVKPRLAVKAIRTKAMNEAKNAGLPSLSPVPEDELDHRDAPRIPKITKKPFTSTSKTPFSMNTQVPNASGPQFQSTKRALLSPSPDKFKTSRLKKTPMTRHIQSTSKIPSDSPNIDIGMTPSKVMPSRSSSPPALDPTEEDIKEQAAGGAGKATIKQTNQYMQDIVTRYVPKATSIQSLKGNTGEIPESMVTDLYMHFNALFVANDNLNDVYNWWVGSPKRAIKESFVNTPGSEQSDSPTPVRLKSRITDIVTKFGGFSPKTLKDNEDRIPEDLRKELATKGGKAFGDKSTYHQLYNWWARLGKQTIA